MHKFINKRLFPTYWKTSQLVPIFKGKNKASVEFYCDYCFIWQLSRDCYSIVLISLFRFSVIARKSSMTGSIRIFENSNFTPKLSVLVFLKVKLPNMTDWHILPGLKIDVLIACCRLPVSPRKPSVARDTVPVVIYRSLQQT